ncbi:MAG: ribosome biogenesis GTP-binding protein YihA/YsxC [Thermodesulfobacteriota bacterium]|nr:MAG: ribosome biogenesis GTP-binding protein YihA/YsxC [Thermodesulfobacteriota bacterium]
MKIASAEYIASAVNIEQCPKTGLPEIVLIGRSNVGKSSLINSFTGKKGLAKTSSQPGKTRTMNFYLINGRFYIVDLPGFGYAKVSREERKSWEGMTEEYFRRRESIMGALLILDPRRDMGEEEANVLEWLTERGIGCKVVFTKTDKLSANQLSSRAARLKRESSIAGPVLFSAVTGAGRDLLGRNIKEMLEGDSGH